jgi:predicted TPR repeat methyltransferase
MEPVPGNREAAYDRMLAHATSLIGQRRTAEALPLLERLRHLPQLPADFHRTDASAMLTLGRFAEADAAATKALADASECPAARQLRAQARLALGATDGALDDAAAAVMGAPQDCGAKALLGDALLHAGRFDEAIFFHGQVLQAAPDDLAAQVRLGRAFLLAARYPAAEELLGHAEARAPSIPHIAALRSQGRLLAGDFAGAEECARAALARGAVGAAVHSVLAHALVSQGRLAEAGSHFRIAARLAPQDAYLGHLAAALGGTTTERATDAYVTTLFDGYASRFEASLLALGYRVPGLMRRAVEGWLAEAGAGEAVAGPVLDLGCGTGLAGVALMGLTPHGLYGVDLSRKMLEQAAAKGLYTELRQADILTALAEDHRHYALITAADVFCYLGDLEQALSLARDRLAPEGLLMFTVEREPGPQAWALSSTGRYRHSQAYVTQVLANAGLAVREIREERLRLEGDVPVEGLFVLAHKMRH